MPVGIFTAVSRSSHPLACLQNRTVDRLDHQLTTRECLDLNAASAPPIVGEHRAAGVQDKEALAPNLRGSIALTCYIDRAAAGPLCRCGAAASR